MIENQNIKIAKILIANRGEIAVRIIRAARELGIQTVAIYSDADKHALHVQLADEAYCVGGARSEESYLNFSEIVYITKKSGAQAIHPGYGFLSESTQFAEICRLCKIVFIGPSPDAIGKMGDKSTARAIMEENGVPIIKGSKQAIRSAEQASVLAEKIGYPLLIKASAGGGGKGMRIARTPREVRDLFSVAQQEAAASFGNDEMYLERYVEDARHIEFQILADNQGNVIHLGERECSIQRRHQKLIEEAPSPAMSQKLRAKMGEDAVRAAKAVEYSGAGTVEFILDKNGEYFFIEMNTRIQVEHPITEMVTGIDLVKEQIRIAGGEQLSVTQKQVSINGHAIECRINAEDPESNFIPSPGKIKECILPGGPGVRVDTHVFGGYTIPPYYDSMAAKVIVHAPDREQARIRMLGALHECRIKGIKTTAGYLRNILNNKVFAKGTYSTAFIERHMG